MGERQVLAGYCLLLPDPVVAHLNVLEESARTQFLADMARVGDAALAASLFHYGELAIVDVKRELAAHNIPVRLEPVAV